MSCFLFFPPILTPSYPTKPRGDSEFFIICHCVLGSSGGCHFIHHGMVYSNDKQYNIQVRLDTDPRHVQLPHGLILLFSMVGALNKLPVAASGMLFFGDTVTFGSVSAIGLGFFAGLIYAVAKNNQKKAENRIKADAIIPMASRN